MIPTDWLVILPVAIPLSFAGLAVAFWNRPTAQAIIGIWAAIAQCVVACALAYTVWTEGPVMMAMSSWAAPFGIVLVADVLSAGLTVVTGFVGVLIAFYAMGTMTPATRTHGFFPLMLALLAGVAGGFLTGDIFNLYVWFEVMLISSFGLFVLGGTREQIDGALKYAALNLVATTIFLVATGLLYGITGTLNMADLARVIGETGMTPALQVVAALYLLSLGMKAAAFPLFFWLPASYHTPQPVVSALFGALLTKVGVYALYRVFTMIFPVEGVFLDVILAIALATMLIGALGALAQSDLRRMVAFLVVSGIGYMLIGLGLGSETALVGSITYLVHSMLITAALFLGVGLAAKAAGSSVLGQMGGIYRAAPFFSLLVLGAALTMAGSPPFSGVWPKVILVQASLAVENNPTVVAILLAGFLSLVALGRAFALGFWRDGVDGAAAPDARFAVSAFAPFALLVALALAIGVWPDPLVTFAERAVDGLLDPSAYITAVLGR